MKPNLEDELDPNNVSGVLKSHIRNNGGLLPKKEAGEMYAAVRQKNVSYTLMLFLIQYLLFVF